ncbi:MAG: 50S ribosomal protein L11 methyltransferase [Oscillospiraceae bacterium]|nr:50S ribosomal protein L11 methyltransferase [Oscillospiraceae bacterium]
MKWLALHIDTSPAGLEPVETMLSSLGIDGLVIEDEADFRRFLEQNRQYWDYVDEALDKAMTGKCRVTFYVEESENGFAQVAAVRIALADLKKKHPEEYAPLLMTMDGIEDADWENNWKAFYKPLEIGGRLMVIPDWEEADSRGRVALRLNPGLAFGTGSHATTRLCLTELEKYVRRGMKMLDLGCGSGILSIAALLLGAESAMACDVDEKAVDIAYENAALNGVDRSRYTVLAGDVLGDSGFQKELGSGYDVVAANIVADVIIALAPNVHHLIKKEGVFICSGIIDTRAEEVRSALEDSGLLVLEANALEGWYCFVCR